MDAPRFEQIWLDQISAEKSMLLERAASYATNGDRLGNFYEGAHLNSCHPLRYGFSLVSKHIIAMRDLIVKVENGTSNFSAKELDKFTEFVTDIRNYSVLLKALYIEHKEMAQPEGYHQCQKCLKVGGDVICDCGFDNRK